MAYIYSPKNTLRFAPQLVIAALFGLESAQLMSDDVLGHLSRAALLLRQAAHRDDVDIRVARKLVQFAETAQTLIEAIDCEPAAADLEPKPERR
jgi:hypothetical protein